MGVVTIAVNMVGNNNATGAFSSMTSNLVGLESMAQRVGTALSKLSDAAKLAGVGALGAGLAFAAFKAPLEYGFTAAADLESALVRLQIATQSSSDAMPVLTSAVNDLAVKTIY